MYLYFQSVFGMVPYSFEPSSHATLLPDFLHLGSVLHVLVFYQALVFNLFNKKGHLHGEKVHILDV